MPSLRTDKNNQWLARVMVKGKQVATKFFPAGEKFGASWQEAKKWEDIQRAIYLSTQPPITTKRVKVRMPIMEEVALKQTPALVTNTANTSSNFQQEVAVTHLAWKKLSNWGNEYLRHVKRTMSKKTLVEKQRVIHDFFGFCGRENLIAIEHITKARAYAYLSEIKDDRGSNVANKHRKNLLAAWNWGADFIERFPQSLSPFLAVKPFAVKIEDRYVPSDGDLNKVIQQASGQDLVFLLTLYYTGARVGEIFRLTWKDVDFGKNKIRLSDNKAGNGQTRVRWLPMHEKLIEALQWWRENRPIQVNNVFMQIQSESSLGAPFTQRMHFMERICKKAKVKHFGFHAIRHKSAAIAYAESGISAAQTLMGHYRASTTDMYVKSAGLYANQNEILDALSKSDIGVFVHEVIEDKLI